MLLAHGFHREVAFQLLPPLAQVPRHRQARKLFATATPMAPDRVGSTPKICDGTHRIMTIAALATTSAMAAPAARPLAGRVAIVTGSTSGIGLGILEVLAGQGAKVVMNGFGDAAETAALAQRIMSEHETEILYHGADGVDLTRFEP